MRTIQEVSSLDARLTAIRRRAMEADIDTGTLRPLQLLSLFCRWFLGSDAVNADKFAQLAADDVNDVVARRIDQAAREKAIGQEMIDLNEVLTDEEGEVQA